MSKNVESGNEDDQKHKARVVLGGHNVRDTKGEYAIFGDVSNTPSSMAACRIAIACEAVDPSLELLQSDCLCAYTQAPMTGPPTFIRCLGNDGPTTGKVLRILYASWTRRSTDTLRRGIYGEQLLQSTSPPAALVP